MRRLAPVLFLLCASILSPAASGALTGAWSPDYHATGADADVLCSTVWEGEMVVGGAFAAIGPTLAPLVARWHDGAWQPVGVMPDDIERVLELHVHAGQLYALGYVSWDAYQVLALEERVWAPVGDAIPGGSTGLVIYDDALHAGRHRWDGTTWIDVLQTDGAVHDLVVHEGLLVAGGAFTSAAGVASPSVAAWDGESVVAWPGAQEHVVKELAIWGGELYAGRDFAGESITAVQRWTGDAWADVPALGVVNLARKLGDLVVTDHQLLACGYWFPIIVEPEPQPAPGARSMWGSFVLGWDGAAGETVYWVEEPSRLYTVVTDGAAMLGAGRFTRIGAPLCSNLGWLADGVMTPVTAAGLGAGGSVEHLEESYGQLAIAGSFAVIANQLSLGAMAHQSSGWLVRDLTIADQPSVAERVEQLTWHGYFLTAVVNGHFNVNAGHWWIDQWVWGDDWNVPVPADLVSHDGRVLGLASGAILDYTDHEAPPVWMDIDGHGDVLLRHPSGDLIVGGEFTAIDGTTVQNVARIGGGVVQPLGAGLPERVDALATWNGQIVAAREADGGDWSNRVLEVWDGASWQEIGFVWGRVGAMCEFQDQLVVGGAFNAIDTTWLGSLAAWDGGAWTSPGDVDGSVAALAVHLGDLWVGGDFLVAGGVPSRGLARYSTDVTGVEAGAEAALPSAPRLAAPAPNPFNPRTTGTFTLPAAGHVALEAFDARGRRVATLLDAVRPAGRHELVWEARDAAGRTLPSGTYLLRLRAGAQQEVRKALLVR
ncbi:hypothetical protein GF314_02615 [bacterium]|nr:hypothetical protein [bacterium]